MIQRGKIFFILCMASLAALPAFAQQFNYTAALSRVDTTGFYVIPISSRLSAYIKTDLADIRIADENKHWVPHILRAQKATLMEGMFTSFPILQNSIGDSGKNLLIIENTKAEGISNLLLFLKNIAVSRSAILSGSNNQRDWYIIDDKVTIARSYETLNDEYPQEINFPLAKYRYLKIKIDNVHNDPLFITKAGIYAQPHYKRLTSYQDNPIPVFSQNDTGHYSYIEVRQDDKYPFDKISLEISNPKFYNRDMQICLPEYGKNNTVRPGMVMANFKLLSALPAIFELPRTRTTLFYIIIKNADNPPLKIEKVSTQQQMFSLVTYLERGKRYDLLLGDEMASFADYDLQTFKDSITILRPLSYGTIYPIKKTIAENTASKKNSWIWPCIIFAAITLTFLTYRLTGEINKSKK